MNTTTAGPVKTSNTTARVVVADDRGHQMATAPLDRLAPLQFNIGHILVPVDFSKHSAKAFRYAQQLATQFGARLTLLNVVEPVVVPVEFGAFAASGMTLEAEQMDAARKELTAMRSQTGTIPSDFVVARGTPWSEITNLARIKGVDLVVIATHGYTGLKHMLLGSVAEQVVRHAPCPVLVVRSEEKDFV